MLVDNIMPIVAFVCAIVAAFSFGAFSRKYEPLARMAPDPSLAAALLYSGAATILLACAALSGLVFGWGNTWPDSADPFSVMLLTRSSVVWGLGILIVAMSVLYYAHIGTEARCRRTIGMGAYAILFQLNVLVIAILEWLVYRSHPTFQEVIGGALILFGATVVLLNYSAQKSSVLNTESTFRKIRMFFSNEVLRTGLISAVACGAALYVDGEVGKNYLFPDGVTLASIPTFFLYEATTFGFPALLTILERSVRYGFGDTLTKLREEFNRKPQRYFAASLFSAAQFVFSVFALSLPGSRFMVAGVLGLSPVISVIADPGVKTTRAKWRATLLALVALIGVALVLPR